ncbi:hypothetical protein ABZW49_45290 [Nonomuraea wenchangensis]
MLAGRHPYGGADPGLGHRLVGGGGAAGEGGETAGVEAEVEAACGPLGEGGGQVLEAFFAQAAGAFAGLAGGVEGVPDLVAVPLGGGTPVADLD